MDTHERPAHPAVLIDARTMPLQELFAQGDLGLFVPMMLRAYIWQKKEVLQLLDDIVTCVRAYLDDPSAIHYFGTIILQDGFDVTQSVRHIDRYTLPPRIYTIIDGHQRLATFALVACLLYRKLGVLRVSLVQQEDALLRHHIQHLQEQLLKMFSCEIRGVSPQSKPIILHGRSDFWASTDVQDCYRSSLAKYLFRSLTALWNEEPAPIVSRIDELYIPIGLIDSWLHSIVTADSRTNYPTPWNIRSGLHWLDPRLFAQSSIAGAAGDVSQPDEVAAATFIRLFALTQTFLQRCCVTIVMPTRPEAALNVAAFHEYKALR